MSNLGTAGDFLSRMITQYSQMVQGFCVLSLHFWPTVSMRGWRWLLTLVLQSAPQSKPFLVSSAVRVLLFPTQWVVLYLGKLTMSSSRFCLCPSEIVVFLCSPWAMAIDLATIFKVLFQSHPPSSQSWDWQLASPGQGGRDALSLHSHLFITFPLLSVCTWQVWMNHQLEVGDKVERRVPRARADSCFDHFVFKTEKTRHQVP